MSKFLDGKLDMTNGLSQTNLYIDDLNPEIAVTLAQGTDNKYIETPDENRYGKYNPTTTNKQFNKVWGTVQGSLTSNFKIDNASLTNIAARGSAPFPPQSLASYNNRPKPLIKYIKSKLITDTAEFFVVRKMNNQLYFTQGNMLVAGNRLDELEWTLAPQSKDVHTVIMTLISGGGNGAAAQIYGGGGGGSGICQVYALNLDLLFDTSIMKNCDWSRYKYFTVRIDPRGQYTDRGQTISMGVDVQLPDESTTSYHWFCQLHGGYDAGYTSSGSTAYYKGGGAGTNYRPNSVSLKNACACPILTYSMSGSNACLLVGGTTPTDPEWTEKTVTKSFSPIYSDPLVRTVTVGNYPNRTSSISKYGGRGGIGYISAFCPDAALPSGLPKFGNGGHGGYIKTNGTKVNATAGVGAGVIIEYAGF